MRIRIAKSVLVLSVVVAAVLGAPTGVATAHPVPRVEAGVSSVSASLWQSPWTRYIVVLGTKMGTFGQAPGILTRRLDVGAALAKSHPFNRVIVSGGNTWWLPISEAQFMNVGLFKRGVPPWQVLDEGRSLSTVQNATYTVAMLKALHATGAVIVTNPFHMTRAIDDFRTAARHQHINLRLTPAYA